MPGFPGPLVSIGNLCDSGLHYTFTKLSVFAHDPHSYVIKLQGWPDKMTRLWQFPINNTQQDRKSLPKPAQPTDALLQSNSACDLPISE